MTTKAIPSHIVDTIQPSTLWENVEAMHYPMAMWQLPTSNQCYAIVDLRPEAKILERSIESLEQGFLINPFSETHPPKSYFLKADLTFKWRIDSDNDAERDISPKVSSEDIDRFTESLAGKSISPYQFKNEKGNILDFTELVKKGLREISTGSLQKVVLSRFEDHQLPDSFSLYGTFESLAKKYPNALKYAFHIPKVGTWIGATPEELISITDNRLFKTVALAGTQAIPNGVSTAEIGWRQKEIEEQAMVSRYIIDCFKKIRLREFDERGPWTVKAGNLAHLKTEFHVDMHETNSPNLGSVMANLLHPTSAVCGMPYDKSLKFIKHNEGYDRSFYAGFLGPVNFEESTNLFVNLRCMQKMGSIGRFYAGAGITIDSDPEKEYEETSLKLRTMKNVILAN